MIRKVVLPIKPPQRRTKAAWSSANLGSAVRAVLASRAGIGRFRGSGDKPELF
jgi:hypothetical protein